MKEIGDTLYLSKLQSLHRLFLNKVSFSLFNTVIVRFVVLAISFASTTFITRILSVEDRGKYAILINLLTVLMSFFVLGFHTSIVYSLSRKKESFSSLYGVSFLISLLSLFLMITSYFSGILNFFFPEFNSLDFFIVIIGCPIILFSYFNSFFFLGKDDFNRYNLFEFIKVFLFIVLIVLFHKLTAAYQNYVFLFILSNIFYIIFCFYCFYKNKFFDTSGYMFKKCLDIFKNNFKYSIISYISGALSILLSRYCLFFIGMFLEMNSLERQTLGFYSVALATMDSISIFPSTLAFFIFPKISIVNNMKEKRKIAIQMIITCLLFFLLISILSFTVAEYFFVLLYGQAYQASVPLFQLLLPMALFVSIISCISSFIGGIGMEKTAIYAPLWGLIIMIAASFFLLRIGIDIYKIIYIQNVSYFIYLIIYLRFFIKNGKEISKC